MTQPTDRPNWRRDLSDLVARRAIHLPEADRALLAAAMDRQVPIRDLAAMTGRDHRYVRNRVRQLTRRILSERFAFVVRNQDSLSGARRRIAIACILHGRSIKDAAAATGTTEYNVRKQMDAIQLLIETAAPVAER